MSAKLNKIVQLTESLRITSGMWWEGHIQQNLMVWLVDTALGRRKQMAKRRLCITSSATFCCTFNKYFFLLKPQPNLYYDAALWKSQTILQCRGITSESWQGCSNSFQHCQPLTDRLVYISVSDKFACYDRYAKCIHDKRESAKRELT